ncbi:MAG: zinc ribbon domain-containing protein [Bacteroidales bacterium]|nr:zinc ribbon domain-containing protein [Bacteroidales bacterium]
MALINCPECNKEISDKVKSCPHCGYPLSDNIDSDKQVPINVNLTSINLGKTKNKDLKKIGSIIIVLLIISALIFSYVTYRKFEFKKAYTANLNKVTTTMLSGASIAEELTSLTARVWRNTIFEDYDDETDKYTRRTSGYGFNSDFNTSIFNLYADSKIITKLTNIKENQAIVATVMKELKEPTKDFERCYETLNKLYAEYLGLTDLAISPQGSLQSFNESSSKRAENFMQYYRTITTQIPDK